MFNFINSIIVICILIIPCNVFANGVEKSSITQTTTSSQKLTPLNKEERARRLNIIVRNAKKLFMYTHAENRALCHKILDSITNGDVLILDATYSSLKQNTIKTTHEKFEQKCPQLDLNRNYIIRQNNNNTPENFPPARNIKGGTADQNFYKKSRKEREALSYRFRSATLNEELYNLEKYLGHSMWAYISEHVSPDFANGECVGPDYSQIRKFFNANTCDVFPDPYISLSRFNRSNTSSGACEGHSENLTFNGLIEVSQELYQLYVESTLSVDEALPNDNTDNWLGNLKIHIDRIERQEDKVEISNICVFSPVTTMHFTTINKNGKSKIILKGE